MENLLGGTFYLTAFGMDEPNYPFGSDGTLPYQEIGDGLIKSSELASYVQEIKRPLMKNIMQLQIDDNDPLLKDLHGVKQMITFLAQYSAKKESELIYDYMILRGVDSDLIKNFKDDYQKTMLQNADNGAAILDTKFNIPEYFNGNYGLFIQRLFYDSKALFTPNKWMDDFSDDMKDLAGFLIVISSKTMKDTFRLGKDLSSLLSVSKESGNMGNKFRYEIFFGREKNAKVPVIRFVFYYPQDYHPELNSSVKKKATQFFKDYGTIIEDFVKGTEERVIDNGLVIFNEETLEAIRKHINQTYPDQAEPFLIEDIQALLIASFQRYTRTTRSRSAVSGFENKDANSIFKISKIAAKALREKSDFLNTKYFEIREVDDNTCEISAKVGDQVVMTPKQATVDSCTVSIQLGDLFGVTNSDLNLSRLATPKDIDDRMTEEMKENTNSQKPEEILVEYIESAINLYDEIPALFGDVTSIKTHAKKWWDNTNNRKTLLDAITDKLKFLENAKNNPSAGTGYLAEDLMPKLFGVGLPANSQFSSEGAGHMKIQLTNGKTLKVQPPTDITTSFNGKNYGGFQAKVYNADTFTKGDYSVTEYSTNPVDLLNVDELSKFVGEERAPSIAWLARNAQFLSKYPNPQAEITEEHIGQFLNYCVPTFLRFGFAQSLGDTESKLEQNIKNQVLFFVINYTILPMSAILKIYADKGIVNDGSNFKIGEGTKIKFDKQGNPIVESVVDKKTGKKIEQAAQHKTYHFSGGLPEPPVLDKMIPYVQTKTKNYMMRDGFKLLYAFKGYKIPMSSIINPHDMISFIGRK